jgi:hypothetical protein
LSRSTWRCLRWCVVSRTFWPKKQIGSKQAGRGEDGAREGSQREKRGS